MIQCFKWQKQSLTLDTFNNLSVASGGENSFGNSCANKVPPLDGSEDTVALPSSLFETTDRSTLLDDAPNL